MNPFDNLTNRQHTLVMLALKYMKLAAHDTPEEVEYAKLLLLLEQAVDKPDNAPN